MTRVVFDLDFDQGAWPGPLSGKDAVAGRAVAGRAVAGEVWLGPLGLLGLLETRLGLDGLHATELERSLALLRALRARTGFWSESLGVDPIGTARHVLHLRDSLQMHGLASRPVDAKAAPRLASLLEAAHELPPGLADRLEAAALRLASLDPEIEELRLLEEPGGMPAALRGVLEALGQRGVKVVLSPLPPAGAGSPRLLRTQGVLEAAEETAAWLAQDHESTVVISPDPVLDAALRRHGLPTLGAAPERADTALLAALPLALELGRAPQDPQAALDLLALPGGPVPAGLCRMLADTLDRWPAVGGARWKKAIERYLGGVGEPGAVERYRERLDGLFEARVPRGQPYPAAEARRRAELLGRWARGDGEGAAAVRAQCAAFVDLLEAYGQADLDERELGRLVEEASLHAPAVGLPPQAGLARVGRPGGVAGPARRVVWWRFVERAAGGPRELPAWLVREARAAGLGELLPDLRALAVRQAARERRPFEQATGSLLLVAPARGEDGQDDYPHPAWGEIRERTRLTVSRVEGPARVRREAAALPVPAARFQVAPGTVDLPAEVSPSKLEKLLGCPLAWTLGELGIGGGLFGALAGPGEPALEGDLAHAALEQALLGALPTPDQAEARALGALDKALAEGGAGYLLPGNEARLAELRMTVRYAARDLATRLAELGLRVRAVEQKLEAPALGRKLKGRLDLALGDPPAVLDLKRGGGDFRRTGLERGEAVQLAAYSLMLRGGRGAWPAVAYYIVREAMLLSTDREVFRGGVQGPGPAETWKNVERGVEACREELVAGRVRAAGVPAPEGEAEEEAIGLRLEPPCGICDLGALCGRSFGGG